MGSYTFKWEHPASEVYVTGTFDDWGKTVKLEKKDGVFEKTVELPDKADKVLYKFVADGNWTTSSTKPSEDDGHGNLNNVLKPEELVKSSTISSAAPGSTTAAMAGAVPKEPKSESKGAPTISSAAPESTSAQLAGEQSKSDLPGAFPETPQAEQMFNVNPIPATSGTGNPVKLAPGEKVPDPSTLTSNTVNSTVQDDPELKAKDTGAKENGEQTFGVTPIPATEGLGNPVHLAPGEKVPDPSTITSNTVQSTVKKDPASYEASDAAVPSANKESGSGAFGVPPVINTMIPESSLPMGEGVGAADTRDTGPTIQSAAPASTTAGLAGQVPKEPRGVPEVVTESQKEAHVDPEASANPEAVAEKKAVEKELESKAINTMNASSITGYAGTAEYNHDAATTTAVPPIVEKSIKDAHEDPEAAANPEAVAEKAAVEHELEKKIPESNEAGEPAPTESAALSAAAPSAEPTGLSANSLGPPDQPMKSSSEPEVKPPVALQSVPPSGEPTDLNASAATPAQPATQEKPMDSRDVSPKGGKPVEQPTVTTGTGTATAPTEQKAEPSTPAKKEKEAADAPQSAASGTSAATGESKEDKKKKRRSIFGKLKDKFKG